MGLTERTAIPGNSYKVIAAAFFRIETLSKDRMIGVAALVLRDIGLVFQGLDLFFDWTYNVRRIGFRLNYAVFLNNIF